MIFSPLSHSHSLSLSLILLLLSLPLSPLPLFLSAICTVPQIKEEPDSVENACPGKPANFVVKTSGNNLTYIWYRQPAKLLSSNDKRVVVGNDAFLHIDKVESSDEGYYVCSICNATGGSVDTKPAQLITSM